MNGDFLPEYRAIPTPHGWRPSFKRFVGQPERLVPYEGGPRYFPSQGEAEDAAKEYMRGILNPPIRAEQAPPPPPDILNISRFHEERIARQVQSQEEALGGIVVGRRVVKVERRNQRERA